MIELHKPSAIELAEGALLADIAVLFQLLVVYLPIGSFFSLLIPTVFAVVVLRHGFYIGVLSLCVAVFVACVLTGVGSLIAMLFPGGAGLFLGITMKYRMRHGLLVLLGVIGSTVALYALLILTTLLTGLGMNIIVLQLRGSLVASANVAAGASDLLGLGAWWRVQLYPSLASLAHLILDYWSLALLFVCVNFSCPLVVMTYVITNSLVRLLGYRVRPFPDGWVAALIARVRRLVIRSG